MKGRRKREKAEWERIAHLGSWMYSLMGNTVRPRDLNPLRENIPKPTMSEEDIKEDIERKTRIYNLHNNGDS